MDGVVLAHRETFRLGEVEVRPSTRLLRRRGEECRLEPRVMQVLVTLADAEGGVVSRDDLIECCWDGRVVGDDCVNRAIYRLRQIERQLGAGSFAIQTISRVGYRLKALGKSQARPAPAARRNILKLAVTGLTLAVAVGGALWSPRPSTDLDGLLGRAQVVLDRCTIG